MKKNSFLFIIIAFTVIAANVEAQQVISTSGGHYQTENISMSWTVGEPVIETFAGTDVILTQGFQQPYSFFLQQILNIPIGWSGISGYIDPMNKALKVSSHPGKTT